MYSKAINDLTLIENQLDSDINITPHTDNTLNQIAIKIVHFKNTLRNTETFFISSDSQENAIRRKRFNEFKRKSNDYMKIIGDIRNSLAEENVVREDNVEFNENNLHYEDNVFMQRSTNRINEYIFSAIDQIHHLKRQRVYIDNTREKLKGGLYNIGLSSEMVELICTRYLSDYSLFWAGVIFIVFLIFCIRYFVK